MRTTFGPRIALLFGSLVFLLAAPARTACPQSILVAAGATWKYLDNGSDQGTAWRESGFDDSAWLSGPAQLGYGDGDEATVVGYGPDPSHKYVTTYFRHRFDVSDPAAYDGLVLKLLRDDGAVVYLNGVEVCSSNMPAGQVGYRTLAYTAVSGTGEYTFYEYSADPALLETGQNVLAVEVHQSGVASSDVSFDLELASADTFRKQPYLTFDGDPAAMTVHWQLRSSQQCAISWGLDSLCSAGSAVTSEYGTDHQHSCAVPAVAADAKHYFRVVAGTDTLRGSFRSAPSLEADSLKFFAYGDSRTNVPDHDQVAGAMVAQCETDPEFQTLVLSVGDLVTHGDQESYWDAEVFDPDYAGLRSMLAQLPYQSAMGNHEESGALFAKYFPYPFVGGRYWSFDYGPAHFAMVDQYTGYGRGSAQLEWLTDDLASTDRPWKFVCLHEPGWSAGGGHENDSIIQNYYQPLFEESGVSVVFGGHNHYYARCDVNGVQHVTTGGGGAPLYAPDTTYPNVVAAAEALHYCTVEIDRNALAFMALKPTGEVIDQFTLVQTPIGVPEKGPGGAGGPGRGEGPRLSITYPNPFKSTVRLSFSAGESSGILIRIFSVEGRLVRTLAAKDVGPGEREMSWDGLDDAGRKVASGVYICRLDAGGRSATGRIVLLREAP